MTIQNSGKPLGLKQRGWRKQNEAGNKGKARPCTALRAMPNILQTINKTTPLPLPNSEELYKTEETSRKLEKEIKNIVKIFSKIEESI